jgi:hypothetical protein
LPDDDWITWRSMENWKCYVQYILIANFVSFMNSGCFMRLSNKCSFKYSAAREPPWPERIEMFQIDALRDNRKSRRTNLWPSKIPKRLICLSSILDDFIS